MTISNLNLEIKKGSENSTVIVTYNLCFTSCEVKDKTTFVERVTLRSDDPGFLDPDDHLRTLSVACVQAAKPCVPRKITRSIPNSVLNEDDHFFNRDDEIYARVSIVPFQPNSVKTDSNIITGYF